MIVGIEAIFLYVEGQSPDRLPVNGRNVVRLVLAQCRCPPSQRGVKHEAIASSAIQGWTPPPITVETVWSWQYVRKESPPLMMCALMVVGRRRALAETWDDIRVSRLVTLRTITVGHLSPRNITSFGPHLTIPRTDHVATTGTLMTTDPDCLWRRM